MFEFDWADRREWAAEDQYAPPRGTILPRRHVAATLLLHWREHCVECAAPDCYAVCPLYHPRRDGRCARFRYGVFPHPAFSGLLDCGADIRFRRWGKIESRLYGSELSPSGHRRLARLDRALTGTVGTVASVGHPQGRPRRLTDALTYRREILLRRALKSRAGSYDDFVVECYLPESEPLRLILEYVRHDTVRYRHAFDLQPGHNFATVPAARFGEIATDSDGKILLYPDNDAERRLIFTWLDFVKYAPGRRHAGGADDGRPARAGAAGATATATAPAEKVKCVAWDLDGTLWHGILVEDGPDACRLRDGIGEVIDALDARGILQTVVSKNDHDEAWALLTRLGLSDYFLYPAINWGRKSEGLKQVADKLNIGIDTFAFVDDSAFERAEVAEALPMIRVYGVDAIPQLLHLPELDVPVTSMSRARRLSYLAEMERARAGESYGDDYAAFLRSCEMRMRLFVPSDPAEIARCHELIQRSNQLNLSKRAYDRDEFAELVATPGIVPLAVECRDRFGDYGIVGFASVDERPDVPLLRDFALSCRVAQKRVEHTFFSWLGRREDARGHARVRAELVRTSRNGPLVRVFDELPFEPVASADERTLMEMRTDAAPEPDGVVTLEADVAL